MESKNLYQFWISHSMLSLHVGIAVISVFMYLISQVGEYPELRTGSIVCFVLGALHFFLHTNLNRQYHFLYDNRNIKSMPQKKIRKLNRRYMVKYLFIVAGVSIVSVTAASGKYLEKMKDWMDNAIAWVLKLFFKNGGIHTGKADIAYRYGKTEHVQDMNATDLGILDKVISVIQMVLITAGILFILILFGFLLYNLIKKLLKRKWDIESTVHISESKDLIAGINEGEDMHLSVWSRNPNIRIRRYYKREIRKLKKTSQKIRPSMSPGEIEQMVGVPENSAYQQLHDYYMQARYSNAVFSKEDCEKLKRLKFKG